RAGWQLRLYGSSGTPGGGPNDAVIGPVVGIRDLLRDGIATAIKAFPMQVDQVDDTVLQGIYGYLPADCRAPVALLVLQSLFSIPEYGGNRDRGGWRILNNYPGDSVPFGYSYVDAQGKIQDRPAAPVTGPEPTPDQNPMDSQVTNLFGSAALALGGK